MAISTLILDVLKGYASELVRQEVRRLNSDLLKTPGETI